MTIGLLEIKFSLPEAHSLKDKRMLVRSMKERVIARMNVSAAEVGNQDFWKSASFAFVTVSGDRKIAEKRIADLLSFVRSDPRMIVIDIQTSYL